MNELLSYIDGREQEMLTFLEQIVNMDSSTLDKAGTDRLGNVLAQRLESLGFAVEQVPQSQYGDHVVGRKPGTGDLRILLVSPRRWQARPAGTRGGSSAGPATTCCC